MVLPSACVGVNHCPLSRGVTTPITVGILEDDGEFREFIATLVRADSRTSLLWTASTSAEAIDRSISLLAYLKTTTGSTVLYVQVHRATLQSLPR